MFTQVKNEYEEKASKCINESEIITLPEIYGE